MWDTEEEDLINLNTPRIPATNPDFAIEGKPLDLASKDLESPRLRDKETSAINLSTVEIEYSSLLIVEIGR